MASNYFIHKSSVVDKNVTIGDNTKIWHFSHILKNTIIGEDCVIGQNCMIGPNVNIGSNVKIQNNVSIYDGLNIKDDVFIGPSVVFTNVMNPRSFINRKQEFKETLLNKGCTIGANATIICGVNIGEYSFVGAGAVINKNILPFEIIVGNPGKRIGWMSKIGNRLDFKDSNYFVDSDGLKYELLQDKKVKILL
tara:strand:+ start:2654 stop:3232 length:579 start_codon:yes stop_codon:yes gene_type:complete